MANTLCSGSSNGAILKRKCESERTKWREKKNALRVFTEIVSLVDSPFILLCSSCVVFPFSLLFRCRLVACFHLISMTKSHTHTHTLTSMFIRRKRTKRKTPGTWISFIFPYATPVCVCCSFVCSVVGIAYRAMSNAHAHALYRIHLDAAGNI